MKIARSSVLITLILLGFLALAQVSSAQAPPPPPTSGSKGDDTNKGPGGGAPLAESLGLYLALVAGYTGWKCRKKVLSIKF